MTNDNQQHGSEEDFSGVEYKSVNVEGRRINWSSAWGGVVQYVDNEFDCTLDEWNTLTQVFTKIYQEIPFPSITLLIEQLLISKEKAPLYAIIYTELDRSIYLIEEKQSLAPSIRKHIASRNQELKGWLDQFFAPVYNADNRDANKDGEEPDDATTEDTNKSEARKKLLLMRELGVLDLLVKKLSKDEDGNLNDKDLSQLISIMVGENAATIAKDLMLIHHNIPGSKDRPINPDSVKKIQSILSEFGLQVQNLPIAK